MTKKHKKHDVEEVEGEQETQEQGSSWEEPEQEQGEVSWQEQAPLAEEEPKVLPKEEQPPEVMPRAASAAFYITFVMTYPPGATQIGQATTYQIITPWGQSTQCMSILDAMNQMVAAGSAASGQMWNYLNNGVTRGLATGGGTVPTSATYFQQPP